MIAPIPTTWCAVYTYSVNSHDIPPLCILPILHPHRSLNNTNNNNHPHSHNTHPLLHPQRLPRLASPRPRRHPPNTQRLPPHLPPPPLRPPQPPRSSTPTTNPASTRWLPSLILTTMQTRPPPRRPRNSPPPPNNPNRHTGNLRSPHVASRLDSRQTRTLARAIRGYVLF